MGIMMVTSLSAYAKNMKMAVRWQERQEKSDFAPDKPEFVDKSFQNKVEEDNPQPKRSSQMETDIEIKLTAGKKLSAEEMAYLKAYDPSAYQKAKTILQERKAYEKALEACQTKDEVEQLKARYAEAAVERIRMIRKTPGLSGEKKRELLKMEHLKAAALDDAMHEFTDSLEYHMLPGGEKSQENERDMEGARKSGIGLKLEPILDKKAGQGQAVKEAAEDKAVRKGADQEEKDPVGEVSADDAAEEGSIMKAILDEEARWAREDEENAASAQASGGAQGEEIPGSYRIKQAKAAYFASQAYTVSEDAAMIDVKK